MHQNSILDKDFEDFQKHLVELEQLLEDVDTRWQGPDKDLIYHSQLQPLELLLSDLQSKVEEFFRLLDDVSNVINDK